MHHLWLCDELSNISGFIIMRVNILNENRHFVCVSHKRITFWFFLINIQTHTQNGLFDIYSQLFGFCYIPPTFIHFHRCSKALNITILYLEIHIFHIPRSSLFLYFMTDVYFRVCKYPTWKIFDLTWLVFIIIHHNAR